MWLSEGFATYFAGLFIEKYEGQAAFQDYMKRAAQSVFSYEKQSLTPIHDTATQDLFQLLNPNNYQKGAWALHMLRGQMGDDKFFQGIKLYYESRRHGTATTEDLRAVLEQSSGQNLREFFQRWIYDTGHPRYAFSYRWTAAGKDSGALTIFLDQKQANAPFLMPVPVTLTLAGGKTRQLTLTPTGRQSVWSFPKMPQPLKVQFDADETLLKEIAAKP